MNVLAPTQPFQSSLGEPVDIQWLDIPNVSTPQEFSESLERIVNSDLPGFIVRQSAWEEAPADNEELAEFILSTLGQLDAPQFTHDIQIDDIADQSDRGEGRLHIDNFKDTSVQAVNGHTTLEGSGAVLLAESGPATIDCFKPSNGHLRIIYLREVREQFSRGKAYPQVMSPTVHTGFLRDGDHIVFPFSNSNGPIWHRFDTASATRKAAASFLNRE